MSAILFAGGQVSGLAAIMTKDGLTLRGSAEPLAAGPLRFYLFVSVTSTIILGFVLLWAAGIMPPPRYLSGSASCLAAA